MLIDTNIFVAKRNIVSVTRDESIVLYLLLYLCVLPLVTGNTWRICNITHGALFVKVDAVDRACYIINTD